MTCLIRHHDKKKGIYQIDRAWAYRKLHDPEAQLERIVYAGCNQDRKGYDAYLWSFTDGKQIDGHWKSFPNAHRSNEKTWIINASDGSIQI